MKPVETGDNFGRTQAERQQYMLTCILAAGKQANDVKQKVNSITADVPESKMPCDLLLEKEDLREFLKSKRTGMYERLLQAIPRIVRLDLKAATNEELQTVPGVGPKTSRLFLLRTRPNVRHAAIDTHTLKFLRDNGVADVPTKLSMSECEYLRLEAELLRVFDEKFPNLTPAEADAKVWDSYRH